MQAEIQRVNDLFAAKSRDLETLARERDEAIREIQVKTQYFHVSVHSAEAYESIKSQMLVMVQNNSYF